MILEILKKAYDNINFIPDFIQTKKNVHIVSMDEFQGS